MGLVRVDGEMQESVVRRSKVCESLALAISSFMQTAACISEFENPSTLLMFSMMSSQDQERSEGLWTCIPAQTPECTLRKL
jgi:hypothetical protein